MTKAILTDDMTVEQKVIALANDAARCFVDEFGEPLHPAHTDWDSAAWETDLSEIRDGLSHDDIGRLWDIYQAALVL